MGLCDSQCWSRMSVAGHESEFSSSLWNNDSAAIKNYPSNLTVNPGDSADTKILKHVRDFLLF